MKKCKMFKDSAPFLLVLMKSVQDNTSSYHPSLLWEPDYPLGECALEASSTYNHETMCKGKDLELTSAL